MVEDGGEFPASADALAGSPDEGAPVGPSPDEEAALFASERPMAAPVRVAAAEAATEPDASQPLPPLEDLVGRISAPTRELLDELFRAKFVTVKRVPSSALK